MAQLFNTEYEKSILGIMLLDNSLIDIIASRITKEVFCDAKCKRLFEVIIEMWHKFHSVTQLTLSNEMQQQYAVLIMELTDLLPDPDNWEFYVTRLIQYRNARDMRNDLGNILNKLDDKNIKECLDELNTDVCNYLRNEGNKYETTKDLCIEISEEVYAASKKNDFLLGFDTGIDSLNDITDGFQTENLYVLGARPSIGKTACALTLVSNLCKRKIPCGFISLEMSNKSLIYRLLSAEAKLPAWQIKKGACMTYVDGLRKFENAASKVFDYPLSIFDRNIKNDNQIFSTIRYEAKINNLKFFVIDHLGLVKFSNPTAQRYADIGNFTSGLKDLAKELDVCILLLCQCGREAEGKKPNMSLLRESGNIEQDADVIMFLHRERDMEATSIPTELIVEKNRDGKLGTVKLNYLGQYTKFVEDKGLKDNEKEITA